VYSCKYRTYISIKISNVVLSLSGNAHTPNSVLPTAISQNMSASIPVYSERFTEWLGPEAPRHNVADSARPSTITRRRSPTHNPMPRSQYRNHSYGVHTSWHESDEMEAENWSAVLGTLSIQQMGAKNTPYPRTPHNVYLKVFRVLYENLDLYR